MGQYFQAVLAKADATDFRKENILGVFYSWDYGNGGGLMEHSYVDNDFVGSVMDKINELGKCRLCWAGDYADKDPMYGLDEDGDGQNLYNVVSKMDRIMRDYSGHAYQFLINHDKKLFVDVYKCRKDNNGCAIHPMPLLCCQSNGLSSDDYQGEGSEELVGTWCGDIVSVSDEKPKGYKRLVTKFF